MCKAKIYIDEVQEVYERSKQEYKELTKKQSELDKKQSDILHFIENENFNASRGYCLAKEIKNIRNERRKLLIEMETLKIFIDNVGNYSSNTKNVVLSNEARLNRSVYHPRYYKAGNLSVR